LYTVSESGRLSAFDVKTGKEVYLARQVGLGTVFASPVAANGHLYLCGMNGSVMVFRAGGKVPARVSRAELGDPIAATPAICGDTIYIRTNKTLYAFAEVK
jgi:hypothetical protein